MHPLNNGSQAGARPPKKPLSGEAGWFTESGDNNSPSYPGADWFNNVIAEFLNAIAEAGITFAPQNDDHLKKVFQQIFSNSEFIFLTINSMKDGTCFGGKIVEHKLGNVYKTLDGNGTVHHWKVTDEIPNGHTKIQLTPLLTASVVPSTGENTDGLPSQPTMYAEPLSRFMFGMEYSSAIYKALSEAGVNPIKWLHSGDSTTGGDAAEGFSPSVIMSYYAESYGVPSAHINRGHSGKDTVEWNEIYVEQDIAAHPDMTVYSMRWGINDASSHGDPAIFEAALRSGLQKLRNFKDLSELTIVLMSPNSTYDPANNRDQKWYEKIVPIIKKAARNFKCLCYDVYGEFRDSYNAAGVYMDDPYSNGSSVHPYKEFNAVIYRNLAMWLFGSAQALRLNTNRFSSIPSGQFLPEEAALPSLFHKGRSMWRALPEKGWPLDGMLIADISADGVGLQTLIEFSGQQRKYERVGSTAIGTWSSWRKQGTVNPGLGVGWATLPGFEPLILVLTDRKVTLVGGVSWFGNGAPPPNSVIASIPPELRPAGVVQDIAKTQSGTTFSQSLASVAPDGIVSIQSPGDGGLIMLNMSWVAPG